MADAGEQLRGNIGTSSFDLRLGGDQAAEIKDLSVSDGEWLSLLLRGAGLPRHALRLRKFDDALSETARATRGPDFIDDRVAHLVNDIALKLACKSRTSRRENAMLERKR